MECIFCYCEPETSTISCKEYGCDHVSCIDCVQIMIDVCFNAINSMPACECGYEYLSSQLSDLPKESKEKYIILCKRANEQTRPKPRIATRAAHLAMIEEIRSKTRKDIREALPPAISNLMIISGLESKLMKFEKTRRPQILHQRRCVSFTCNGLLHQEENILKCSKCSLLVCSLCDAVRSKSSHECKKDEVESRKLLNSIAKCPTCGVPATRGDGCIFITCPYCHTSFDSNTGLKTEHGGHNNGEIKGKVAHTSILEIVPDTDSVNRTLLMQIRDAKPGKISSRRPDIVYESKYKHKVYLATINRIYELRDSGRLTIKELTNILKYLQQM